MKPVLNTAVYCFSISLLVLSVFNIYYANRVLPGVYLNAQYVGNLPYAKSSLDKINFEGAENAELNLKIDDSMYVIPFDDLDLAVTYDLTYKSLYSTGRENYFQTLGTIIGFIKPYGSRNLEYSINEYKLNKYLSTISSISFPETKDAYFYINENNQLDIKEPSIGHVLNLQSIKDSVLQDISNGELNCRFSTSIYIPTLLYSDLFQAKENVSSFLNVPVVLDSENYTRSLTNIEKLNLLDIYKRPSENTLSYKMNKMYAAALINEISSEVNVEPKGTEFKIQDNKVEFDPPRTGWKMDLAKSLDNLIKSYTVSTLAVSTDSVNVPLVVEKINPPENSNEYGITELIAEGVSYFKGSAASRISNIVTASNKLSGTLVAPGDSFSFNKAVGPIDIQNGFNEAYVISKGRTVLGTGGGVCQASTTVFRAALNGGFPITARTAHAYRVGYYEQGFKPGLDATIYQPTLDFAFKNDTKHHILVFSTVDTTTATMTVKIYGTGDGRKVELSEPKMISQIPPPEAKYIETHDLPKGVVKQVEYPAWGGQSIFTRVVTNSKGAVLYEDEFKSNYTPWAAVFEKGV